MAVPFAKWCEDLDEYLSGTAIDDVEKKLEELLAEKTKENLRYDYMAIRIAERRAQSGGGREALSAFAGTAMPFLRRYYQEHILTESPELLPPYGEAAARIEQALALEESDPSQALALYGKVVDAVPQWADVMKSYLLAFGVEQRRKKRAAAEELQQLKARILEEAGRLAGQKQYAQALAVLVQLKEMVPDDLDTASMVLNVRMKMLQEG
jgi:hypothetical protein